MKAYIKEHLIILISVAAVITCALSFFATKELIAMTSSQPKEVVPEVSSLQLIGYDISEDVHIYSGEPIETTLNRLVLEDDKGERIVLYSDRITNVEYSENVECGYAKANVSIEGYTGVLSINNIFRIMPQQAHGLAITEASLEHITLVWDEVSGVDGYLLYKSKDNGVNNTPIKEVKAGEELTFQDTEIELNATYLYHIKTFVNLKNENLFSVPSETVQQDTPLETASMKSASGVSYDSIKVQWHAVAGAVGYQVFRSDSQNGSYTCIAEINNGAITSYTDSKCELGIPYYYYVKACQATGGTIVYGEASDIKSTKTNPNRVSLAGATLEGNTGITLSWDASGGAQGYELYKSTDGSNFQLVKTYTINEPLTWNESGMGDKDHAYYKVRAYASVNGTTLYSVFSSVFSKQITIDYGQVAVLTQYVGRPYVYGGTSPTNGWDCSGFVQYAYRKHFGISLPRSSGQQVACGTTISKNNRSAWKPGDLIFYTMNGRVNHVAVYLGNNQIIHALSQKRDTFIIDVDTYENWDNNTMYCVKRVLN